MLIGNRKNIPTVIEIYENKTIKFYDSGISLFKIFGLMNTVSVNCEKCISNGVDSPLKYARISLFDKFADVECFGISYSSFSTGIKLAKDELKRKIILDVDKMFPNNREECIELMYNQILADGHNNN